jgi:hypothetical protein
MTTIHEQGEHALDEHAFRRILRTARERDYWQLRFSQATADRHQGPAIHLAVFVQPFLEYLLDGRKTIESRFSAIRCAPFGRVAAGDLILVKASGGPVVGVAEIGETWSYRLDPESWKQIRRDFTAALCAQDPAFWESRQHATFATLLRIRRVERLSPVPWRKRDRRGWVVLTKRDRELWD